MEKPFTLKVNETKDTLVEVINNANLPAYVLKQILKELYNEIEIIEQQEIQKYNNQKESDK